MTTLTGNGAGPWVEGQDLLRGVYENGEMLPGQNLTIGTITETDGDEFTAEITDETSADYLEALGATDRGMQLRLWHGEWWAVPWAGGCFQGGEQDEGGITVMGCALLAGHDGDHLIP